MVNPSEQVAVLDLFTRKSLASLRNQVAEMGWQRRKDVASYEVWGSPIERRLQIVLPLSDEPADEFQEMMGQAADVLAHAQKRPRRDVRRDLLGRPSDLLRVRYAEVPFKGEAPLPSAVQALQGLHRWVVGATAGLTVRRHVLPPRRPAATEAFVRQVSTGTEAGSYVVRARFPVSEDVTESLFDFAGDSSGHQLGNSASLPLGRRVSARMHGTLVKGLSIAQLCEKDPPAVEAFTESFDAGYESFTLNATELDGLAALTDAYSKSGAEVRFSPTGAFAQYAPDRSAFYVPPAYADIFRGGAELLRGLDTDSEVELQGLVVNLDREAALGAGDVRILAADDDTGISHRVRVNLSEEDYALAVDAHKLGRMVAVSGLLRRSGTRRHLNSANGFHVLGPYDESK